METLLLSIPSLAIQAGEFSKDASSTVLTIKSFPDSDNKRLLVQACADSLKIVWAVMCALSGAGMSGSIFIRKDSLDRALNSEQALKQRSPRNGQDLENTNMKNHR